MVVTDLSTTSAFPTLVYREVVHKWWCGQFVVSQWPFGSERPLSPFGMQLAPASKVYDSGWAPLPNGSLCPRIGHTVVWEAASYLVSKSSPDGCSHIYDHSLSPYW